MMPLKIDIQRALSKIENIYPPDDLILNYRDFLKNRDYLHFYQYNPEVLNKLLKLTIELWESKQRISRSSLIFVIKRYIKVHRPGIVLDDEIKSMLFELFKQIVFHENLDLHPGSIEILKKKINYTLMGERLNDVQLVWMCENAFASEFIMNRVLRYPYKTGVISSWVKDNFENDQLRLRRAEMIGWMLNEDPDFVVPRKVLSDDFKHTNELDKQIVQQYKDEMIAVYDLNKELISINQSFRLDKEPTSNPFFNWGGEEYLENVYDLDLPSLNLTRRFYPVPRIEEQKQGIMPDFPKLEENFIESFDLIFRITMIWGIAYSHLDVDKKSEMIMTYHLDEIGYTTFHVAQKINSPELLRMLLGNC